MLGLEFISGGTLTFGIILLALFVLWILYKIIIRPLFSLLGFGTKSMGSLVGRGLNNMVDDWTKGRAGEQRSVRERSAEGEEKSLARKWHKTSTDTTGLLRNISSTQDFNSENVKIMNDSVKLQEQAIREGNRILNDLASSYKTNRKSLEKIIDDVKAEIRRQEQIENQALEIARKIEKYHVTVDNNAYGRITQIAERIKSLQKRIQPLEQRNIELSRTLEETVSQRKNLLEVMSTALGKMKSSLKKDPVLPELQNIAEQQNIVNAKLETYVRITQEAESLLNEHTQITHQVNQILAQVIPLLKEQQEAIQESTAQLTGLINRGAIPKNMAA